jgi:hypothetical protein
MQKSLLPIILAIASTSGFAATRSFEVTLLANTKIDGDAAKAGTYKVIPEQGEAIFEQDGHSFTVHAHEVVAEKKFASTELVYKDKDTLKEIRVGGTKIDLVIDSATNIQSGL